MRKMSPPWFSLVLVIFTTVAARGQSFQVQCPASTITHPAAANNNSEPDYAGPTVFTAGAKGYLEPSSNVNGAIKCQQISGGDGFATMGDGSQTYLFAFGPLAEAMGGSLTVQSEVGVGSTFTLSLLTANAGQSDLIGAGASKQRGNKNE
jgi:hypothetical protein